MDKERWFSAGCSTQATMSFWTIGRQEMDTTPTLSPTRLNRRDLQFNDIWVVVTDSEHISKD
jgi:hypothetical protein